MARRFVDAYHLHSDERGAMAGVIGELVAEVERLRLVVAAARALRDAREAWRGGEAAGDDEQTRVGLALLARMIDAETALDAALDPEATP